MTNKRILTLITLLLFLFLVVGCDVIKPNQPPIITSDPVETATVGVDYTYDVDATDPNTGDVLTYSLTTEPLGMVINGTNGVITWKADDITTAGVGDYDVVVVVSDDGGLSDSQDFTITVSEFVVELIGIEVDPKEMTLSLDAMGTFEVTAHYNDDSTKVVTSDCDYGSSNNSIATVDGAGEVTAVAEGTAIITVTYEGKTDAVEVTVGESKSMEIIADALLTFTVDEEEEFADEEGEFTVSIVANSDVDKMALCYFTLPPGTTLEYYDVDPEWGVEPGWYPADFFIGVPTEEWEEWVFGPPDTGSLLCDITFDFRAKFGVAGTYPTLVEVWEVTPNSPATKFELLGYKLITFEVVPAPEE